MNKQIMIAGVVIATGLALAGGYASAQDKTSADREFAQGPLTSTNESYREQARIQKSLQLDQSQQVHTPDSDAELVVAHTNLDIDKKFGTDFRSDKRKSLNDAQRTMLKKKAALDALYNTGKITLDEYTKRASEIVDESLDTAASSLSDGEFLTMFGVEKGKRHGAFLDVVKEGSKQK